MRIFGNGRFCFWMLVCSVLTVASYHGFAQNRFFRKLALPHFSSPRGFYDEPFNLVVSCATPKAVIIYTTDGSAPSRNNGVQSSPSQSVEIILKKSTLFRAIAVKEGVPDSTIVTHTYLFPSEILKQLRPDEFPQTLDMEMDPERVSVPEIKKQIHNSFRRIPTVSLVVAHNDFWGPLGIYLHPKKSGEDWERHCSFEWIPTSRKRTKQAYCGVQIQGGTSRILSPKLGLRLNFKSKFGSSKFRCRLFPKSKVKNFDSLILRNPTHDSWCVSDERWRRNARYVNDMWASETQRLMGHLSPHHRWVNLFINGFYWGLYDLSERPDEHFASAHLGGSDEDYDVFNVESLRFGSWDKRKALTDFLVHSKGEPAVYRKIKQLIDVDGFIDYVLYNLYANKVDWVSRNYWFIGKRTDTPRFQFLNWDSEILFWESWENPNNPKKQTSLDYNLLTSAQMKADIYGVGFFLRHLSKHHEFRRLFGDRAHFHTRSGGILSPEVAANRYRKLLDEVEPLLDAESARWGDSQEDEPLGTDTLEWEELTGSHSWLFTQFFPKRTDRLLEQLKQAALYPRIFPPVLSASEDSESSMWLLSAKNPNPDGKIIFTTNNIDPISLSDHQAFEHSYQKPVLISRETKIMARVSLNGQWSALEIVQAPTNQ